ALGGVRVLTTASDAAKAPASSSAMSSSPPMFPAPIKPYFIPLPPEIAMPASHFMTKGLDDMTVSGSPTPSRNPNEDDTVPLPPVPARNGHRPVRLLAAGVPALAGLVLIGYVL